MNDPRIETTDAQVWAGHFAKTRAARLEEDGFDIAADEDTMLGWFANAIERGREAGVRAAAEVAGHPQPSEAVKGKLGDFEEVETPVQT